MTQYFKRIGTIDPMTGQIITNGNKIVNLYDLFNRCFVNYTDKPMTASADNAPIQLKQNGVAGYNWYVSYFNWRLRGSGVAPADITITIKDGANIIYQSSIAKDKADLSLFVTFAAPLKITAGNDVTLNIGASGATGAIIIANIGYFKLLDITSEI